MYFYWTYHATFFIVSMQYLFFKYIYLKNLHKVLINVWLGCLLLNNIICLYQKKMDLYCNSFHSKNERLFFMLFWKMSLESLLKTRKIRKMVPKGTLWQFNRFLHLFSYSGAQKARMRMCIHRLIVMERTTRAQ